MQGRARRIVEQICEGEQPTTAEILKGAESSLDTWIKRGDLVKVERANKGRDQRFVGATGTVVRVQGDKVWVKLDDELHQNGPWLKGEHQFFADEIARLISYR